MKRLLMLAFAICFILMAKAQIAPEKLLGTWTLIKYDHGYGKTGDQTKAKFKIQKIIDLRYFTVLDYGTTWATIKSVVRGTNQFNYWTPDPKTPGSGVIREHVLGGTANTNYKDIKDTFHTYKVDDEGMLHMTGWNDHFNISELWMPVIDGNWLGFDLTKTTKDSIRNSSGWKKNRLVVIKTKDGYVKLRQSKDPPNLVALITQENIEWVELLGDEEAVQQYGMDGRFGVVVVKIVDRFLQATLIQLRKQKVVD